MAQRTPETTRTEYGDYVAAERAGRNKHELVAGEVFAMAGGSRAHSLVAVNVARVLANVLAERPCLVFNSDMRVKTGDATGTYPDVSALCATPLFSDEVEDELLNPSVIVEVLSDSTEAYDRGEKFEHYRTVASLSDYVLVSSSRMHIELFTRQPDGSWSLHVFGPGQQVPLRSLECELSVDDAFHKVLSSSAGG